MASSLRKQMPMRMLAIVVACLAVARHARRVQSEGQQVTDKRNQEHSMKEAPTSQSFVETGRQVRLNPIGVLGRIFQRQSSAAHTPSAPHAASRPRPSGCLQDRGRCRPPVMSMFQGFQGPPNEDKDQRPPWLGLQSYRYVDGDDPTFQPYARNQVTGFVCQTPEQFSGLRLPGAYQGSFRIQFTLPGRDDDPKTIELQRSTKDNPSYGAVKVKLPLSIEVGIDLLKFRLVIQKVGDTGKAQFARIREGDFVRGISVPEGDGMVMLDQKFPPSFYEALKKNKEFYGREGEVVLLIERPTKTGGDDDWWKDMFSGGSPERVREGLAERMKDNLGDQGPGLGDLVPNPR